MQALKCKPACKDYLWGGSKLKTEFKKESNSPIIAETWELSCHPDGPSIIQNGPYAGKSLAAYIAAEGREVLGKNGQAFPDFPILIKLIDAADRLSVQVHPDDTYAARVEGQQGKTEMWYIIACEPGAELLYGLEHEISKEEMARRIQDNTLLEVTRAVPVHPGEVFFIGAGTLHAIGKGILLAEIQQNSNVTYRLYDYGRVGADGQCRPLHIQKALEVTDLGPVRETQEKKAQRIHPGWTESPLADCPYFKVSALEVREQAPLLVDDRSFQALLCLEGKALLQFGADTLSLEKGDCVFLPAGLGTGTVAGQSKLLLTAV